MSINGRFERRIILELLLGSNPSIERKREIAAMLAEKVGRTHDFTVGYLENIVAGRQILSSEGDMYRALELVMEEVVNALLEKIK